jgi:hypothetical protein
MALLPADEVAEQQRLLETYRRTLAIYLRQRAELGGDAYSPPAVLNGIDEARHNIARIKALLCDSRIDVDDDPDDEAAADWAPAHRDREVSAPAGRTALTAAYTAAGITHQGPCALGCSCELLT